MANQGSIRLKVTNDAPAIKKLWNGRFKLEFLCDNNSPKEDWYYDNISSILPDYGILQDTNFGSGVSEDWEAIPASVYPDMRLVETEYVYIPSIGDKRVKLTYETLTASWVEEKDEDTDYELNGLKRVSRTFVALPDTAYDKVVGTSTIDSDGTTLYLGSFKIEKTEAKWELTEVWLEAGILSETLDNVGSQKAKVIETIGTDPITPPGYLLASTRESDIQGIKTNQFTFLKNGAVISESRAMESEGVFRVTKVFFNNARTTVGPIIAQRTDNVDGMPTISITTLQDADGNSIVDGGENLVNQVSGFSPFTYPGVLNVERRETTNNGGGDWLQVKGLLVDAPAQCKVRTTTYFIFQTSNSIESSDYNYKNSSGLWSPNHWAAFSLSASGSFDEGLFSDSSTFRGYRTSSASQSGTLSGPLLSNAQLSWQGQSVLVDSETITYDLVVDQGPVNPIGNTYTLDVQITPAFDDIDGNKYYKKTIVVTDAIPSQPDTASLPYTASLPSLPDT